MRSRLSKVFGILRQEFQQGELFGVKLDGFFFSAESSPVFKSSLNSPKTTAPALLTAAGHGRTPEKSLHPGQKNAHIEGFSQIVVGSLFQPYDGIQVRVPGGEHKDGSLNPGLSQVLADRESRLCREASDPAGSDRIRPYGLLLLPRCRPL